MSLEIITGSMFSGKSSELVRRVKRLSSIGMKCLVINHSLDTRVNGDFVQTHCGTKISAKKTDNLNLLDVSQFDVIAIDEVQFFSNLKEFIFENVEKKHKHVIMVGLSGDSERAPFGEILSIIPLADQLTYKQALCAICKNGTLASFTKRISSEKETISIDSTYLPVCRKCYNNR